MVLPGLKIFHDEDQDIVAGLKAHRLLPKPVTTGSSWQKKPGE